MAVKKQTYEEAIARLNQILKQLENNELSIDSLGDKLKEAQALIEFCRNKIYKTEEEVNRVLGQNDETMEE